MSDLPLSFGVALVALGVLSLRLGKGRARGRWPVPAGWVAILAGTLLLAARDGAWGVAIAAIAGSAAAGLILAFAIPAEAAERKTAARTTRATLHLQEAGSIRLLARLAVFLLVTVGAFAASVGVGLAAQALGRAAGWAEADTITAGLLIFPMAWALLVTVMMLRTGPAAMLKPLGATVAVSASLFWLAV